jgi:uncharacterized membrane protein
LCRDDLLGGILLDHRTIVLQHYLSTEALRQPVSRFLVDDLIVVGIVIFELRGREHYIIDRNAVVKTQATVIGAALQGIFLGLSKNAVMTQIWIALWIYLLLAFLKFQSKLQKSTQQILRLLQLNLFEKRDLIALLRGDPPCDK